MTRCKEKRRTIHHHTGWRLAVLAAILLAAAVWTGNREERERPVSPPDRTAFQQRLEDFAGTNDLPLSAWPKELTEAAERNPELAEFVLYYPLREELVCAAVPESSQAQDGVPLLLQWDLRWGYTDYSGGLLGLTGCGPACLAMVATYLRGDDRYDPAYMARFSTAHGYSVRGNGSAWTLISEGGPKLGLDVTELPLDEGRILRELEAGNPIICVMGPGDFTTTGHFIVLTGTEEGRLRVNDPNSRERSGRLWDYDRIKGQIRNLWVCR